MRVLSLVQPYDATQVAAIRHELLVDNCYFLASGPRQSRDLRTDP